MSKQVHKHPEGNGPPGEPNTFSSPPLYGSRDVWLAVASEVDAVPAEEAQRPRVDLQAAAECALAVCDGVRDDATLYGRFQALAAAGEADAEGFRKLQRYAGAAWHARRMQLQTESADGDALVPPAVVAQATELLTRMLPVVTYYVGSDPAIAPVLVTINQAPGHRRLANHLLYLADVYQAKRAALAGDTVHYRATDEDDARKAASAIVDALSDHSTGSHEQWSGRCARVWTLLSRCYEDVQAAGMFLLRGTPEVAKERFPSLVSEARSAPQPRKEPDAPSPVADPAQPVAPMSAEAPAAKPRRRRRRR